MRIADVRDAVVDDRGELDQGAEADAPDRPEGRPQADVRLRLRPLGRCAVHRPLQLGPEDPNRDLAGCLEVLVHRAGSEAACIDGDVQRPAPGHLQLRDTVHVGPGGTTPEADDGAVDAEAAVAVDDGDDELRAARDRDRQRSHLAVERGRSSERLIVLRRAAAGCGRPGDEDER